MTSIECKHFKRQIVFPDNEDESCLAYNGKSGICEPLVRCDNMLNEKNLRVLRQSLCGYDNEIPKVCCPLDNNKQSIQSTTRFTTRSTTIKPKPFKTTKKLMTPSLEDSLQSDEAINPLKPKKLPKFCGNRSITSGTTRIVGGKVSRPGSWPWIAAIFVEDSGIFSAQCGGALISQQEVLTASHCVVEGGRVMDANRFRVRLGEHNIAKQTEEDAEVDYNVMKVTAHPNFEPQTFKNDVAIIKLNQKVNLNRRVYPICLPYDTQILNSEDNIGRSGFIIGWGKVEFNGNSSDKLREASIQVVSNQDCGKAFDKVIKISDEYMCAGTVGSTKDSCQGDSGGPLMQIDPNNKRFYLTGIVSFGRRCATPGFPGVYARVSHYLQWISNNI
ncbi:proclotting enzyme-like [Oppia nitens]|uniref:proclotting enzyme-like n=1 Tax=Oppia nitens TaxID=1686743 RepID=UPI0023DC49C8|nr:proclotting enzyme-like [Oppia nitens]